MAEALYRKYRPQVFADMVGQDPIARTLRNALEQDKVSHAYLFCGPRGTGKTTTARLLSKALLCQRGPTADPDGTCEDCRLIAEGAHPDVYELDAASRTGVDNVREEIISRVQYAPTRGRSKIYIIDEVHMLSPAAFNALLKTLEEPPGHVVFILCTTDPQKVPETIHSRCQRFDFHRIAPESIVSRLGAVCVAEGVEFEGEALDLIAQRADGGMRNALTSLEQIIAFENGAITLTGAERLLGSIDATDMATIMELVGRRDAAGCFRWVADYVETGADLAQFVRDMAEHTRNLYVMTLAGDEVGLEVSAATRQALKAELQWFGPDRASRMLGVLGDVSAELKTSSNPRLSFEIALTRMVRPDSDLTLQALAERVEALEGNAAVTFGTPATMPAALAPAPAAVVEATPAPAPVASAPKIEPSASAAPASPVVSEEQPASTPAAASQGTSAATGLENPAALQRLWQTALADVKKKKQAHAVLFMNTKAQFDTAGEMLRILFPEEATFAFNAVQRPEVQDSLAESLAKAAGRPLAFSFSQGAAITAAPASTPVVATPASTGAGPSDATVCANGAEVAPAAAPAVASEPAPVSVSESAFSPASPLSEEPAPIASPDPAPKATPPVDDPAPLDDEPPLSVYDDMAPANVPFDADVSYPAPDPAPAFAPEPAPSPDPAPAPAEQEPTSDARSLDEVQSLLQNGFGTGIVLEEVDE